MSFPVQGGVTDQASSSTTVAYAFGSSQTLGNINVVGVLNASGGGSATLSSLTDSQGNVYQEIIGGLTFSGQGPMYLYWCPSIKAGANTVTATWSVATTFTEIIAFEYPAISNAVIDVSTSANQGGSNVTSLSIGPINVTAGDVLISYLRENGASFPGAPSGMTLRTGSNYGQWADLQSAAGGVTTVTWSWSIAAKAGGFVIGIKSGPPQPPVAQFVQGNYAEQSTSQTSISCTFSQSQSAGDASVVMVWVNSNAASPVSTLTDTAGNTYNLAMFAIGPSGWTSSDMLVYVATNIKSASAGNIVTAQFSQAFSLSAIQILEYPGFISGDTVSAANGTGTVANSGTLFTNSNNEILIGFVISQAAGGGASVSVNGYGTKRISEVFTAAGGDVIAAFAGNNSLAWNVPNGNWVAITLALSPNAAPSNGLSPLPPMGWDPWRVYSSNSTDAELRTQASLLVSTGLAACGFNLMAITDGWPNSRVNGVLTPNPSNFPNGMLPLIQYFQSLGLQYAAYLGTGSTTCAGSVGSGGNETADAALIAGWGAKYLMYDSCTDFGTDTGTQTAYAAMGAALQKTGAPIQFLVSCPVYETQMDGSLVWGPVVGGNLVCSQKDIVSPGAVTWAKLVTMIEDQVGLSGWTRPGRWNWIDFMGVGNGTLTDAEGRSNFALFAILATALWIGCDLTTVSSNTLTTLKNTEVIAVSQDVLGIAGTRYSSIAQGGSVVEVWARPLAYGKWAVALWNQAATTQTINVTWSMFNQSGPFSVRDLFLHQNLGKMATGYSASVGSHDVAMLLLTPNPVSPPTGLSVIGATATWINNDESGSISALYLDSATDPYFANNLVSVQVPLAFGFQSVTVTAPNNYYRIRGVVAPGAVYSNTSEATPAYQPITGSGLYIVQSQAGTYDIVALNPLQPDYGGTVRSILSGPYATYQAAFAVLEHVYWNI
jgi:alpha-galactosidase